MKQMKKMTAALTACMLLGSNALVFPVSAEEGTEGTYGSLTYMNYGSYIAITDCDTAAAEAEIPAEIDGIAVTEIARSAFYNCDLMTTVTLPEGITTIGDSAFDSCESLTTIHIPAAVSEIGEEVFEDCDALASITVSEENGTFKSVDGVLYNEMGTALLYYPSAKTDTAYTIPDGVELFPEYAFDSCTYLTELVMPASLNGFSNGSFKYCSALTTITVAEENESYKSVDGVLYSENGMVLLCYPAGKTDEFYIVPDGTAELADYAFYGNMNILSVTIPDSLRVIGDSAFYDCWNMQSITLPDYMQSIGSDAFGFCYDLTTLELPSELDEIGGWTFCYSSSLTELTLPDNLTAIDAGMFQGCSALTSIDIPDSVTFIDMYAFYDCTGLTSVTIPAGVTQIYDGAFDGCTSLTDVYYAGDQTAWNALTIGMDNDSLTGAAMHYGSGAPVTPPAAASLGDLNGDSAIDATDAAMLLTAAALAGTGADSGLTEAQIAAADLNGDGAFDATDAAYILQYAAYTGSGGTLTIEEYLASIA